MTGAPAVRLLGLIEVSGPLGVANLVGARQRALVAVLALNAGAVVSRERLIDALWGEDPPRTALRTLHSHVARVRQALECCGLADVLVTREPGYRLRIAPEQVDVHAFEQAVRRGRAVEDDQERARELGAALRLWRGDALVDAGELPWVRAQAEQLRELRLTTCADCWEARLRLGDHAAAVTELDELVGEDPTRERLAGLLMLALYRCDRQADALDRYERVRAHLAEELGVDPGVTLRDLHTAILRQDPSLHPGRPAEAHPVVRQLPPETGHFTGRGPELSAMDTALGEDGQVLVVSGAAGMGKSALAVRWAHRMAERFPDGQVFIDLRGHDPERALSPGQVLTHVLRVLGVPAERIPVDVAEQTDLFRSLVRDRRMLIVLDDAGTADHVLPLVPPTGTSTLVVTSRQQLSGIAVRYAVRAMTLDVMVEVEAVELLGRILGRSRVDAEPDAVGRLVELCGRMPLALRIAAAKLAYRPRQLIADLVAELGGDDRLDAFAVEGDTFGLRAVFDSAYRTLSEPAAGVFRLLGLHRGTTFCTHLTAAMAGMPYGRARRAVDELGAAHLITETDSGRYRFHDLIRLYAAECARRDETPQRRAEAETRLLDWYLAVVNAANRILDPTRDLLVPAVTGPTELPFAAEAGAVLAFLDREQGNLVPVVAQAADGDDPLAACQLAYLLASFFDRRAHWWERVAVCERGVAAARRLGDPSVEGLMYRVHGVACIAMRRFDDALRMLTEALALTRTSGDKRDEGHVLNNMAVAYAGLRRFDKAAEHFDLALALHTEHDPAAVAVALNNIGYAHALTGDAERAVDHLSRALVLARQLDDQGLEAAILHGLGQAHRAAGDDEVALDYLRRSLGAYQRIGDQRTVPGKLCAIGEILASLGRYPEAVEQFERARQLGRQIDDLHVEAQALGGLGHTCLLAGDVAGADVHLDRALAIRRQVPDHHEEARLRQWLDELANRRAEPTVAGALADVRG